MTSPVGVGALAALAVLLVAASRRPRVERRLAPPTASRAPRTSAVERLGAVLARWTRAPGDAATARRLAWGALVGVTMAPVSVLLALLLPAAAWISATLRHRQHRRREERAIAGALPDVVDLLLLSTGAGTGLALAHRAVAERIDGPIGAALSASADRAERGTARADALVEALSPLGERPAALAHVLADHLRYGTPLAPELDRLGLELRLQRRRRAEEEARRVPVRLLAPLVACTLPAFALLTVAPLLIASLEQIPR